MPPPAATSAPLRKRRLAIALAAMLLVALAVPFAMHFLHASPAPALPLVLVVSADTAGWITPCGCTVNQSGGMPRRGTLLSNLRKTSDILYADAGGATHGTTPYHQLKLEKILRGEMAMGVLAHNLGGPEIAMGTAALAALAKDTAIPFVSANATDAAGKPLAPPLRIVTRQGRRIAFAGVVSPTFATAEVHITDPRPAILDAIKPVQGQYDILVVLAYLPDADLQSLAANLPEADMILGAFPATTIPPHRVGPTLLAAASHDGKFLVQAPIRTSASSFDSDQAQAKPIEVSASLADDPTQTALFQSFLADLAHRDFPASQTGLAISPALQDASVHFAGSASCATCHVADAAQWHTQLHSHAWQTLIKKNEQVDPDCQRCHTTGYGMPGGFESIALSAASRVDVGCENCHGPSQTHVADPHIHTPYQAKDQCIRCHDAENSPNFNYAGYWKIITHGAKLPAPADAAPARTPSSEQTP